MVESVEPAAGSVVVAPFEVIEESLEMRGASAGLASVETSNIIPSTAKPSENWIALARVPYWRL